MPESSYWQLCPPSKSGLQGGLLSSSFPPGPSALVPPDAHLQEGGDPLDAAPSQPPSQHRPWRPAPQRPSCPSPERRFPLRALGPHPRLLRHPNGTAARCRCPRTCRAVATRGGQAPRGSGRPSAASSATGERGRGRRGRVAGGGIGVGVAGGGACPLRAPSSSLNSSLHSSSSPTFFSLALSPDSPLPWSFPWDPSEAAAGGGACCCFFPSPSSCSSSPSPLHPPPPPQRRFSLSPVLIRDSAASTFLPPPPVPSQAAAAPPPGCVMAAGGVTTGGPVPASPSSACSTPSSLRRSLPPQLPRCHSQPCDLLLLKPGLKRRRDPDRPCARPVLDFTKMTQTRSIDPQCLERGGGRLACGGDLCMGMEPFMGDFRGSCSPAECLGRTSIGPLSESDEECREDDDDDEGEEEADEREAAQQAVFERDCTELDLNLIEEN
ncbi:protein FAM53C [Oreochromis niloticus]|uniref:Protein FAM53C n=1 Tax=Oreochromis niloticus TaxID=8128 RepID=I3KN40_ORENI|nr:protein FAM53C [Oreochromis niloticus]XP_005461853.2 protein FAM53C [Oreochromis niloticus]XP_025766872.1 protein FAM53C [Oreochromis niloticus]XP_025766873.1 protein FAM53C [Oreochromis niloticus]